LRTSSLSITNELLRLRGAGRRDQQESIAPVMALSREQPHARSLALND
jgi:hypothetical protein